jgi:hypothetical protein
MKLKASQFTKINRLNGGFNFVAEASDLGVALRPTIILESDRTGATCAFVFDHEKRDHENEVLGWEYTIHSIEEKRLPQMKGSKLTIWND